MKNFLTSLLLVVALSSSVCAETRYKGYNFIILKDVYKYPVITWSNHNKRVDYQAGAIKMCQNHGMELASKKDIELLLDFLINKSGIGQINTAFWLKEIATGQIDSHTYINEASKNYAYILRYNSVVLPPQTYINASDKTSGQSSWLQAVCIADAPPIDDAYRVSIIQDDYNVYLNGGDSFLGHIKAYKDKLESDSLDIKYINLVLENFEKIVHSEKIDNLQDFNIDISNVDKGNLKPDTLQILNIFNAILVYNED